MLIELPEGAVVRRVPPGHFELHYRAKYRAPVRKLVHFILREGTGAAVRKARSKRAERAIERAQAIVIAGFDWEGRPVIGVSRMLTTPPRFDPCLIFPNPERLLPDAIALTARASELAESYLPVPSCPVPSELVAELRRANPGLGPPKAQTRSTVTPATGSPKRPNSGAARSRASAGQSLSPGVYLMGFGGYVREYVLPEVRGEARAALDHKAELIRRFVRPAIPVHAEPGPFLDALATETSPLVIVSTYHSDHAADAERVLEANPGARVFIEKPAAVTLADAERLADLRSAGSWIDVGYNRRWAPLTRHLRDALADFPPPRTMTMSVRELRLPTNHWYHWATQGTRVTGNGCHWIDLAHFLIDAEAIEVSVDATGREGDLSLSLVFGNGFRATLTMTDRGDDLPGVTERIRLEAGDACVLLDDFRRLEILSGGRQQTISRLRRDKGHATMYRSLLARWREGEPPTYPVRDLLAVCRATEAATALHRSGRSTARALMASPPGR